MKVSRERYILTMGVTEDESASIIPSVWFEPRPSGFLSISDD